MMPVHERGYTHWSHSGLRADPPWLVIASRGLRPVLRRRWPLLLFFAALVPAIAKGASIFVNVRAGGMLGQFMGTGWSSVSPEGSLTFIEVQRFFVFLVTLVLGAGLISRDRQDNGLSLYFSRPISLADYLGGKTLVVLAGYLTVTLVPCLLLCLFAYLIDPGTAGLQTLILTPLRLVIVTVFTGVGLAMVLLAFSALATRTVLVVVWWAVLCLGGEVVGTIGDALGLDSFQYLNFLGHWHNASSLLMGGEAPLPIPPPLSLLVCLGMIAAALAVLRRRIEPVEVVT
jgi:ABC-type transport system involved in multi-copper enzyme maturation permease subunit